MQLMLSLLCLLLPLLGVSAEEIQLVDNTKPAGKFHITVRDAFTSPLHCCLTLIDEQGNALWGIDGLGKPLTYRQEPRIWISGDTIISVTPGIYDYVVTKPFNHQSAFGKINIKEDHTAHLQIFLEMIAEMQSLGWFAGDAHQHIVHGEKEFAVNLKISSKIARCEGADWSSFNSAWTSMPGENPTLSELRQQAKVLSDERFLALIGDEYPKDHLGHMAFLSGPIKDWYSSLGSNDYSPAEGEHEGFAHFELMKAISEHGGLTVYTHPLREYGGTEESPANIGRELPFDILAVPHLIPAVDWMTDNPHDQAAMDVWSMYLNWGHQIGICAFSDTCYDRHDAAPLNKRTYIHVGDQALTAESIIEAIRKGHTFGTTGPLLPVYLNGKPPGTVFPADGKNYQLNIDVFAPAIDYFDRSSRPHIERIDIIRNGKIYQRWKFEKDNAYFYFRSINIIEEENAWYVVKAFTSGYRQVAITSPFYFRTDDFTPPEPILSKVNVRLYDSQTKKRINGSIDLIDYRKDHLKLVRTIETHNGEAIFDCSPTLRLRVSANGYTPQTKSIFFDHPALYKEHIKPLKREMMLDKAYYQKIEETLDNVSFDFYLNPIVIE